MHVCHICDSSMEGDYFRNIVAGLTRKGVRLSLVELGRGVSPVWLADFPGVNYFCLNAANKLHYPFAVLRLSRFLKNEKVDILHTHLFYSGLIGVITKRFRRKTIVALMRHHTGVVRMFGSRFHVAADKWMAEAADHLVTVSQNAKTYMLDVDEIKRNDVEVVHLGFDFEKLSPNAENRVRARRKFGLADGDFVIGYAANFLPGKGHIQLIEAFEKISPNIPNAKMLFAGRGMLEDVRSVADKFPAGKIIFAGWQSDVASTLNAMDLFVMPSLSEAFSQVLIEAMGVGLPVITTRVGVANEFIQNGSNGILIEPYDVDAIMTEVMRLYADNSLRKMIARSGMQSVRRQFSAEKMVERQFGLYEKWLGQL